MSKNNKSFRNNAYEDKIDRFLANVGDIALRRRSKEIFLSLKPKIKENVLEIGCGDGYYLYILSSLEPTLRLTGVDINPKAIESAKRNLKGRKVNLLVCDAEKLPYKSGTFDKIIMSEVLEHLPEDIKGLKEAYRVLKNDGSIFITVPNSNYPFLWDPINWILERMFGVKIQKGIWGIWAKHLRLYSPSGLKAKVEKVGFIVDEIKSLTRWSLPFNHYLITLGAVALVKGTTSEDITKQINKFSIPTTQKTDFIKLFFDISNIIDKHNQNTSINESTVGIFVKAVK